MLDRRSLVTGLVSFIAAPAIVRVSSIMPVKVSAIDPEIEVLARMEHKTMFAFRLLIKPTAGTKGELLMLSDWTPVPRS